MLYLELHYMRALCHLSLLIDTIKCISMNIYIFFNPEGYNPVIYHCFYHSSYIFGPQEMFPQALVSFDISLSLHFALLPVMYIRSRKFLFLLSLLRVFNIRQQKLNILILNQLTTSSKFSFVIIFICSIILIGYHRSKSYYIPLINSTQQCYVILLTLLYLTY